MDKLMFEEYRDSNFEGCLDLFDRNCPQYFAENERRDYSEYLRKKSDMYKIGFYQEKLVAAFGMSLETNLSRARITWIMVCPLLKGQGIGRKMMEYAKRLASREGVNAIDIAASHLSAPFFKKFGARSIKVTNDGWGSNMHRVDMELLLS